MRFLKTLFIFLFIFYGLYTILMYFLDDKKTFKLEYEIDFPKQKIYNQFYDLRNFSDWNLHFDTKNDDTKFLQYFYPYKGIGSSLRMMDRKDSTRQVELFIRKAHLNHSIRYDLFSSKTSNPYRIKVDFKEINPKKTKINWVVETPIIPYHYRIINFFSKDFISNKVNQSMQNLENILLGKIEKNINVETLKTDSIFIDNSHNQFLIGIEESSGTKKGELYKSVLTSHNKLKEYLIQNLGKKEDEMGYPKLIVEKKSGEKNISYFYGIPLFSKPKILDNTFKIRELKTKKQYNVYFKGNYDAYTLAQKKLMLKAEKDSVKVGDFNQTFLQNPNKVEDINLKLSLEILN